MALIANILLLTQRLLNSTIILLLYLLKCLPNIYIYIYILLLAGFTKGWYDSATTFQGTHTCEKESFSVIHRKLTLLTMEHRVSISCALVLDLASVLPCSIENIHDECPAVQRRIFPKERCKDEVVEFFAKPLVSKALLDPFTAMNLTENYTSF